MTEQKPTIHQFAAEVSEAAAEAHAKMTEIANRFISEVNAAVRQRQIDANFKAYAAAHPELDDDAPTDPSWLDKLAAASRAAAEAKFGPAEPSQRAIAAEDKVRAELRAAELLRIPETLRADDNYRSAQSWKERAIAAEAERDKAIQERDEQRSAKERAQGVEENLRRLVMDARGRIDRAEGSLSAKNAAHLKAVKERDEAKSEFTRLSILFADLTANHGATLQRAEAAEAKVARVEKMLKDPHPLISRDAVGEIRKALDGAE